jgi:RNA polymerase sigma-70 factor (ECF subfamily)
MPVPDIARVRAEIDSIYRRDSRRVLATLIRLLGDFERAEEGLHEAFRAAVEKWPSEGVPQNPVAWLVSAGRFKSIDKQRREARFEHLEDRPDVADSLADQTTPLEQELLEDDRLRLVFTCCHPALAPDAQVALTLREVCGLATEEVAAAFLTPAPTLAQRIVRAKSKIRDAGIPYEVPAREALPERLESVLRVVYLVFNEGYLASRGDSATRADLSSEAIRLGRLLLDLLPEPEVRGLLALMLLHESRREARADEEGELILLDEQDRGRWDRDMIREGSELVRQALSARRPPGPYAIQAAIAAVHAEAPTPGDTDWREIVGLYEILMALTPSPIVALNRTVAVAMLEGPEAGLAQLDALLAGGELDRYQLAHAARADFCRRLGRRAEASAAYERAIELTEQGPARRFLEKRLAALRQPGPAPT